jgi:hypothetical protein
MSAPLLCCPFCGSANVMMDRFGQVGGFAVSCEEVGCCAIGPVGATREDAEVKWAACDKRERSPR